MKVVIATGTFPPEVSGQATFVANLADRLVEQGVRVSVISYGDRRETNRAYPVHWIPRTAFRYWRYGRKLRQLSHEARFVYAQDLISSGLPAALFKRRRVKLVLRLGGDFLWERMVNLGYNGAPLSEYYQKRKNILERLYLLIYRYTLKRADHVIFNTHWQRELYIKTFKLDAGETSVIENPVLIDTKSDRPTAFSAGEEIIFAGRFTRLKNLRRLLAAFFRIKTDKNLVLIGDGPMREKLQRLAVMDPRVKIVPPLSRRDFLSRLSQSYVAVLPSLSELSPNFALEALSFRKPTILTREAGFTDELKQLFYLINPLSTESIREAIEFLLNKKNYQTQVKRLEEFKSYRGWDQVVNEHLELWRRRG